MRSAASPLLVQRANRQAADLGADGSLGQANVVGGLQIQPELRAGPEPVTEPPGQFGRRDAQFRQFVGQNFAGVDGGRMAVFTRAPPTPAAPACARRRPRSR